MTEPYDPIMIHREDDMNTLRVFTSDNIADKDIQIIHRIIIHGPRNEEGFHDKCLILFDEHGYAYLWREGDE